MKLGFGQILKLIDIKEFVVFMTIRGWRMKNPSLLHMLAAYIKSEFQNIYKISGLHNLLTH